jgi:hypothetical protein
MDKDVEQILTFFKNEEKDYWKTAYQISVATKIDISRVMKILSTSGGFVRSSYRNNNGEPVFTTRELFRNKAPFLDKMIGVFKNRID